MLLNKLNNWFKSSLRLVLTAFVCGLLFISSVYPAQAATSQPSEGEASLNEIQAKTDEIAKSNPRGMEELTKEAEGGLNAVQGSADKDEMISRKDASDETTVEEQAENFLQKLAR